jgi:UDPglucose--hexose-1-phosphate uridylyltransferase
VRGRGFLNSEIRKDYFLDKYVIIAPKRGQRPSAVKPKSREVSPPDCYFCCPQVNDAANQIQIKNYNFDGNRGWDIKVIGNKYPALTFNNLKAYGSQEIIIETPEHQKELHELSLEHIVKIFDIYEERYEYMMSRPGICYTLVFKNEGGKAGASIPHAHSQVIALPIIPPKIQNEADAVDGYYRRNGSCPYCDVIKSEKHGPREIYHDENLFVVAPYASESPYGAWFIPKRHVRTIGDLNQQEKLSLARALKMILAKLESIDVPYNYFIQNALDLEAHHLVLKLSPRPNVWAGLELGTGVVINPVPPEEAAKFYKSK